MALDPVRTARTAVLTPVGFGVLAFDRAAERGRQANALVEERVAPLRTRVKALLDEARAEAGPAAHQIEQRFSSIARRRRADAANSQ